MFPFKKRYYFRILFFSETHFSHTFTSYSTLQGEGVKEEAN